MAILVATDFSPEALEACRIAHALARALQMPLTVAHVLEPSTTFPLELDTPVKNPEIERLHAAKRLLSTIRGKLEDSTVSIEVLNGFVEDALGAFIRTHHTQLLIVGAPDADAGGRDLAEKLAESMPCPVLVTRPITDRLHHALNGGRRLRIVVAMDRTHASDAPVSWVKALRLRIPCDVFLHHFYVPDVEHRRLGVPLGAEPFVADSRITAALERELRQRFAGLEGEGDLMVRCEPHFGSVSVEALCSARVDGADLIVVGTHRRRGVARFLHGSVSRDIIRHSDVPVVCVGPDTQTPAQRRKFHSVLAATDLSEAGNRAVAYAYDLLSEGTGAVDIVYVASKRGDAVSTTPPGDAGRLTPAEKQQILMKLERLIPATVDPAEVSTRCYVIDGGPPADAIVQAAARSNVDAICLASHGRSPIERAFAGSVATEVTQAAQCPVLVVRDVAA